MQREHRAGARPTPDRQLPPDVAALPVASPAQDAAGYTAGYQAGIAARMAMERRRRQVRWLFWSWLLYWGVLLLVKLQPIAAALWARDVARTTPSREPIQVTLTLDSASPALLWIALGPLVLTLLWLLLVRRRARR
jgi:hypothetical protein